MRPNPQMASDDPDVVKELIRRNPWGTFVSMTAHGLVASHYPVILEEAAGPGISVLTHVGRPDDELHELGEHEILLIVQGPHGYISPSWYLNGARVPTWNFTVAHCYGTPEVLSDEENVATLAALTEHFEREVQEPALFDPVSGPRIAQGTVGLRIPITRFDCKLKVSQNKSPDTQRAVIAHLRGDGPYRQPALADEMERILGTP